MQPRHDTFQIRVTASRLAKGYLPIPKKHAHLFPSKACQIKVVFDDKTKSESKSYLPDEKKSKETRVFGLGRWFAQRAIAPGDRITITVEDLEEQRYRFALDRYVKAQQEEKARAALNRAANDRDALERLQELARVTQRQQRRAAKEELLRIARETSRRPRTFRKLSGADQYESVPPAVRVLLRELHHGKCQMCAFTFKKKDGNPYFEIHHLDPAIGHHPANLLVLCANCHAQLEHADVGDFKYVGDWLVALTVNGKRIRVKQPLSPSRSVDLTCMLWYLMMLSQVGVRQLSTLKT